MLYHIYCDESCQNAHRYMVLGGLITITANVEYFENQIQMFRSDSHMTSELKWERVSNQKYEEYKTFGDIILTGIKNRQICFHSLIIDNTRVDHARYNLGDPDIGYYKFFYQLLIHCFGKQYCRLGEDDKIILTFHRRTTKYTLDDLKLILNRGMAKETNIQNNPFREIRPGTTHRYEMLQLLDIIIGAIGFQKNGKQFNPQSRMAKKDLSNYIAIEMGLDHLMEDTSILKKDFTIWNFNLQT